MLISHWDEKRFMFYYVMLHQIIFCVHCIADTLARRSFSAGSRDNAKEKDRDKEKEIVRDDSVIFFEPIEIIRSVA